MKATELFTIAISGLLGLTPAAPAASEALRIPILNPASLDQWEAKSFQGETLYTLTGVDGRDVLKAHSNNAASGMVRKIKVDLNKTPYMHWSWRVENVLQNTKEQTRQGDDYPARVYVIVSGGVFFWQTRALNYVWSSNQPIDTVWPNAYTGNALMLAVQSGPTQTGQWVRHSRNVREDLQRYMQKSFDHIDAVAIMTDTDNSGQSATAYYGEIYFSSEAAP